MAQESVASTTSEVGHEGSEHNTKNMLGPLLCWAVVFADIGTSVYYTPGILYQTVHGLAGFFVFLTMTVFVLLTLKYAEVTHRYPQGGGVVTVGAQALNPWFGALGGMFILVDYFLTAAISSLSGIQYLSVVLPTLAPYILWVTIAVVILLGALNWVGISESAKVSLFGAIIAFISDIAILVTVFTHISFGEFLQLFPKMFANQHLTGLALLIGFANAFLAFSGLESISQLSPVMKRPHKKVAGQALFLVVITIGLTSPLLTLFSTQLLPSKILTNPDTSGQVISLLAGNWGSVALQTEVAISASALLVFASNTAIIGAYHVFMALSRMGFLPEVILKRNKIRDTPHFSIALATFIPVAILVAVNGNINLLGDMYAFGLLGAFTLTCLGLDVVRTRDWKKARAARQQRLALGTQGNGHASVGSITSTHDLQLSQVEALSNTDAPLRNGSSLPLQEVQKETHGLWFKIDYVLGILTTLLVAIAWVTNLIFKRDATIFGGSITIVGMIIAYLYHARSRRVTGRVTVPVVVTRIEERMPNSILAILKPGDPRNEAVIRAAINNNEQHRPVVFLYLSDAKTRPHTPRMMEIVDPYLDDEQAKEAFGKAESMALNAKLPVRKYVYLQGQPELATQIWQMLHPKDTLVSAADVEENEKIKNINPDRIRYEVTPEGRVAHLLKRW
ncbi:APC family permease [Ktedonobacter racemifer]|uniref:Amino acid permease-associated region n=1 Tax=Ktedonobacter racemifer DSM 44963 TaxID=485913 RepID=D6TDK2_KTERA|nr:APC family permease [Ktedonobacter racemifer]EFH88347.1 amino acid permease-associated region [Ktedonobacter racemifer DSM 44963]